MSETAKSGSRRIPEEERKFGLNLRVEILLHSNKPINVIVCGTEDSEDYDLFEMMLSGSTDVYRVTRVGGVMMAATIDPPDIRSQLISIASNPEVDSIEYDGPMYPITLP